MVYIAWIICDVFLKCIQQIGEDQESQGQQYVWETELTCTRGRDV